MTPIEIRTRTAPGRLLVLALLVAVIAAFGVIPSALGLGASGTELWYVIGWILALFLSWQLCMDGCHSDLGDLRLDWSGPALPQHG
jgi:hypothetical protein